MRNEHKDLVRYEMSLSEKYSHDICNLSISDIIALLSYNYQCIDKSNCTIDNAIHTRRKFAIAELEEYLHEFNERLCNRTAGFTSTLKPNK